MAELGARLRAAVEADAPPASAAGLVEAAGGTGAVARALVDLPASGALPAKGTAARTEYAAALRRVQRWTTTGAQKRTAPAATVARLRRVLQVRATSDRLDKLARKGARVRLRATVLVPSPGARGKPDKRTRELPNGGPGVLLKGEQVRAWARPLVADDDDAAESAFVDAFTDAYGVPPDTEFEQVEWLHVWADDEREP